MNLCADFLFGEFYGHFHTRMLLVLFKYPALWFVVKWLEELFDVLPAKDISSEVGPVHLIESGAKCHGRYFRKMYPVLIIAKGMSQVYTCIPVCIVPWMGINPQSPTHG